VTRFVPGKPHATRQGFFQACDLEAMGAFQDWDPGVVALRAERPDLASWAEAAMAEVTQVVAQSNLSTLPQSIVHGDFAEWNRAVRRTDDRAAVGPHWHPQAVGSRHACAC
jgi:hypothetical protein